MNVRELKELYLSHNNFSEFRTEFLDEHAIKGIQVLDLSQNRLKSISHISRLRRSLEKLFLKGNLLETLNENQFADFERLEYIDLSDNQIQSIHHLAFAGAQKLKAISLRDNLITAITKDTFTGPQLLDFLDLSDNKIHRLDDATFTDTVEMPT